MFTNRFYYSRCSFVLLAGIVLALSSCEQNVPSREYEEIVTTKPHQDHAGMHSASHDFMNALPTDHPDILSSIELPSGQNNTELQRVLDASVAQPPLVWKTPKGWIEEKGSSMRLATFRSKGKGGSIECSIISLGGQAGGLQSNVIRWIQQINGAVLAPNQLKDFLNRQSVLKTDGGFSITVIDLTELTEPPGSFSIWGAHPEERSDEGSHEILPRSARQDEGSKISKNTPTPQLTDPKQEQTSSMIGAIAELTDQTIFVKMTGSREAVIENRDSFLSLCKSLKIN